MHYDEQSSGDGGWVDVIAWLLIIVVIVGGLFGLAAGYKAFSRWQRVADARNEIEINRMKIHQTEQLVEIEKQKAAIRIEEARGIAESQRIIDSSLTSQYLTYLAIQAQMKMAESPNHTAIYLPIGEAGVPLVKSVE